MHILITGGAGSSGQCLIRHLQSRAAKAHLSVVSRTATTLPGVARVLTGHYAGLFGAPEGGRLLAGIDAVVHLADGLSILQFPPHAGDEALANRLIKASEALALAVRDARVPLLVHVSSIKALCDEEDDRVLVETSASRSTTLYGRAKWRLEERLAGVLAGSDTRLATVRNPVMYGGAKPGSMSRLLQLVDSPLPLPLAGIANRRSLLAIDNFASALAAILEVGGDGATGAFHLHDGSALSTTEIVETLRLALGRRRRLFGVGALAASIAGRAPTIGPAVRRLWGSLELSDARFRQCFKWTPVIDSRDALARMARAAVGTR
jgi:UDP-N-acetyl-alpha-D-quinovosamine dehydrogenase